MAPKFHLAVHLSSTDFETPLGCHIALGDLTVFDSDWIKEPRVVDVELADVEGSHTLVIELKNKLPEHTAIDSQGAIIKDARLIVEKILFDEIELGQIVIDQAYYEHTNNSTGPQVRDKFYGEMGCNGQVKLEFTTPVYLWLLENM